jgi:hypothetical protein
MGKRHPPRGINSDRMALAALSHGLLTYTVHLQTMVFVLPPWSKPQGFPVELNYCNTSKRKRKKEKEKGGE